MNERALLAIQGPTAAAVVQKLTPTDLKAVKFMTGVELTVAGIPGCWAQRSGYTGEDGFEISVPAEKAVKLAEAFLANQDVKLCGLGARDSLRLEAGLCLYGHDINDTTTPKSANLVWAVPKARRQKGGFLGSDIILAEINKPTETATRRVGLTIEGAPARGTLVVSCVQNTIPDVRSFRFQSMPLFMTPSRSARLERLPLALSVPA